MQAGPEQFQTPAADTAFHKIFHISSMPHTEKNIPDMKNCSNWSEPIVCESTEQIQIAQDFLSEKKKYASRYCGKVP